ncbi:hypothetical protein BGX26_009586 [Mortierella sp. AD094]|nr:hypothetical protein BGX26_009586 [Mortierella sp. AD094]
MSLSHECIANKADPLSGLSEVLEKARVESGIPGMSVALLYKGKLIFAEGFGKRNDYDPFTVDTVSSIASMTKAFTVAAIGELVAEGRMDWDTTPVSKYVPEFELQDPVLTSQLTLSDLLSHRTGYPQVDFSWFWNMDDSRTELIKRLKYVDSSSKLRPYTIYNNVMYGVAGVAGGNVDGTSYEEIVRKKVFEPLGLTNTGFSVSEMKKLPNFAIPYTAASFKDAQNGNFQKLPLDDMATKCAPSGDIYSNVLDLVRWGKTIMDYGEIDGKQVLNKDSIVEALTAHSIYNKVRRTPEFGPAVMYGMGWFLDSYKGNLIYHHGGNNPGYTSNLMLFPDSDLVFVQLTNVDGAALPPYLPYYIADKLLGLPETQDWLNDVVISLSKRVYESFEREKKGNFPKRIENRPTSHELSEFTGVYTNLVYGNATISLQRNDKDEEMLHFKLRVHEGDLKHYHYDTFSTVVHHSTDNFADLLSFETSQDGDISGFYMDLIGRREHFQRKRVTGISGAL